MHVALLWQLWRLLLHSSTSVYREANNNAIGNLKTWAKVTGALEATSCKSIVAAARIVANSIGTCGICVAIVQKFIQAFINIYITKWNSHYIFESLFEVPKHCPDVPSPENPALQEQVKFPSLSKQIALLSQLCPPVAHSSISSNDRMMRLLDPWDYDGLTSAVQIILLQFITTVAGALKTSYHISTNVFTVAILSLALINVCNSLWSDNAIVESVLPLHLIHTFSARSQWARPRPRIPLLQSSNVLSDSVQKSWLKYTGRGSRTVSGCIISTSNNSVIKAAIHNLN